MHHPNIFTCDCSPNHEFRSVEEFNLHFGSTHHRSHGCPNFGLVMDNNTLREKLEKMTVERDKWKNFYEEMLKNQEK